MTQQPTALMILRVWTEAGSTEPLRVDIRQTSDLSRGMHTATLTDINRVLTTVRTFLETNRTVGTAAQASMTDPPTVLGN